MSLDQCLLLPPIVGIEEERRTVFDWAENDVAQFTTLISLCQLHQRRQARTGVHTHHSTLPTENNTTGSSSVLDVKLEEESLMPAEETRQSRHNLRQCQAVIKAEEDRGVMTAIGHTLRWKPGRKPATTLNVPAELTLAGNSANAQEVAATEAKKVCLL